VSFHTPLLWKQGPDLHKLRAQGDHHERQLHRGGPGQVSEDFQAEEARDAVGDWWFHWDNAPVHTAAMVMN
jgi:hypothetical protein